MSAAYAFLAYRTAWLAYYYPHEWYCACLTIDSYDGSSKELIIETINAAKKVGLKILPPDINKSLKDFSVAQHDGEKVINFGFSGIPRVGVKVIDAILYIRDRIGQFESFLHFLDCIYCNNDILREFVLQDTEKFNNPLNKMSIENLIKVGAFDSLETNRFKLLNILYSYINLTQGQKKKLTNISDIDIVEQYKEEEYNLKEKLSLEYDTIGMYISQHPLDDESVFPYTDTSKAKNNQSIEISGIFKSFSKSTAKNGKEFYRIKVEMKDGALVNITVFDNVYKTCPEVFRGLSGKKAKEGKEIIISSGRWNTAFGLTAQTISRVIPKEEEEEEFYPPPTEELAVQKKVSPLEYGGDIFE